MESDTKDGNNGEEKVKQQLDQPVESISTCKVEAEELAPEDSDPDDDDDETPGDLKRLTIDEDASPPPILNKIMITRTIIDGEQFDDNYIYCDECRQDHPGNCPVHGALHRMRDSPVSSDDCLKADHSLPIGLTVVRSSISGAGLGVWTGIELEKRTVFGPYVGKKVDMDEALASDYCWQILGPQKPLHCIDGKDLAVANWMRYCNCSNEEQNLQAFQFRGHIFFRTIRKIKKGSELFVGYGWKFDKVLEPVPCLPLASSADSLDEDDDDDWVSEDASEVNMLHKCNICGDAFDLVDQLTRHQTTTHNFRFIYRCQGCPHNFRIFKELTAHQNKTRHRGVQRIVLQLAADERPRQQSLTTSSDQTPATDLAAEVSSEKSGAETYQCEQCPLRFPNKEFLLDHAVVEHRVQTESCRELVVRCDLCPRRFSSRDLLDDHRREDHLVDDEVRCRLCDAVFSDEHLLAKHRSVVHRLPPRNRRLIRPAGASPEGAPTRHVALGWKPGASDKPKQLTCLEAVNCPHCPMRFTHASVLRNHISTKHPGLRVDRVGNAAVAPRDLKRQRVPPMTVIKCKLCNASFLSEGVLRMHIASKHVGATRYDPVVRPKSIQCPHCPQRFDSVNLIQRHIATQHDDPVLEQLNGPSESGGTAEPPVIRNHARVGQQPMVKRIRKRLYFDRKSRRQECHVCHSTFTQIRSLRKHLRRQHSIRWVYTCLECKESFDVYQKLLTHQQSVGHRGLDKPLGGPEDVVVGQLTSGNDGGSQKEGAKMEIDDFDAKWGSPSSPASRRGDDDLDGDLTEVKSEQGSTDEPKNFHDTNLLSSQTGKSPTKSGSDFQLTSPVNGERRSVCNICGWSSKRSSHLYEHQFSKHGVTVTYKCVECQVSFDFYRGLQVHQKETRHRGMDRVFIGPDDVAKQPTPPEETDLIIDEPEEASAKKPGSVSSPKAPRLMSRAERLRTHKCNVCGASFKFFTDLRLHRQRTHNVRLSYTCTLCRQQFWSFQDLRAHKELRHSQTRRKLSSEDGNEDEDLNEEERVVKRPLTWKGDRPAKRPLGELLRLFGNVRQHPKKFSCDKCNSSFTRNYNLTHHQQRMHGDAAAPSVKLPSPTREGQPRPFPCPTCDASFSRSDRLKLHMVRLHGADKRQPTIAATEEQQRPFPCSSCGTSFSRVDRLRRHQANVHGSNPTSRPSPSKVEPPRPFACHLCDFSFSRLDRLRRHQINVHGIDVKQLPALKEDQLRPFVCRLCDTSFSRHDSLRHHQLRKHGATVKRSGSVREEPPRLQIVIKRSPVKAPVLKAELLKPFACHLCESSFTRHDNLRQHQLKLHGFDAKKSPSSEQLSKEMADSGGRTSAPKVELPRPFACHACDASFSRLDRLKSHRLKMHGSDVEQAPVAAKEGQLKPFSCELCESSFTRHNNLKHHQLEKHGITVK